tara:strand:+ start:3184 stop:3978 length:795 start_codon:yes stop_codon:yes gene_type:complete
MIGVIGLAILLIDVFLDGYSWVNLDFLTNYASRFPGQSGILAPLMGTLWVVGLTAIMVIPVGLGTAIYLEEFAADNIFNRLLNLNISNLAGVPSVIYGLLGLAIFVQLMLDGQRAIIAGSLTMTLLVLPIVIIASQEAIRAVPSGYRDAAFAMGATRWQVVKTVVIPQAMPSVMSGIILALSRAVGESAPILVISALIFLTYIPTSPLDRFTVLPLQIFSWASQPQHEFRSIASAGIIVLLIVLLSMNSIAIYIRSKTQSRSEQ